MWPKRISEVTPADIESIVSSRRQEGLEVEFKASLSGGKENETSKKALAAEMVAFANGFGGILILGIAEDGDHRAVGTVPIYGCRALADRLAASIGDLVDPPLAAFECEGVPTAEDGTGVVVMRVPPSIVGPHWVREKAGGICYVRRNTSAVPCSMREVHQLVLTVESRRSRLDDIARRGFIDCDDHRDTFIASDESGGAKLGFSMDLVATPLASLQILPALAYRPRQEIQNVFAVRSGQRIPLELRGPSTQWRPMLRGRASSTFDTFISLLLQDHQDGTVVSGYCMRFIDDGAHFMPSGGVAFSGIPVHWLMGLFANAMARVQMLRQDAGASNVPYRITTRIEARAFWSLEFASQHRMPSEAARWRIPSRRPIDLPAYEISDFASFDVALNQFDADLRGITGNPPGATVSVDWPALIPDGPNQG